MYACIYTHTHTHLYACIPICIRLALIDEACPSTCHNAVYVTRCKCKRGEGRKKKQEPCKNRKFPKGNYYNDTSFVLSITSTLTRRQRYTFLSIKRLSLLEKVKNKDNRAIIEGVRMNGIRRVPRLTGEKTNKNRVVRPPSRAVHATECLTFSVPPHSPSSQ